MSGGDGGLSGNWGSSGVPWISGLLLMLWTVDGGECPVGWTGGGCLGVCILMLVGCNCGGCWSMDVSEGGWLYD